MKAPRRCLSRGGKPITTAIGGAEFYCSANGTVLVAVGDTVTSVDVEDVRKFESELSSLVHAAEQYRTKIRGDDVPSATAPDAATRVLTIKTTRYTTGGTWKMRRSAFAGRKCWREGNGFYPRHRGMRGRPHHVPATAVEYVEYPKCEMCAKEMMLGWVEAKPIPYEKHPPRTCDKCMAKAVAIGEGAKAVVDMLSGLALECGGSR